MYGTIFNLDVKEGCDQDLIDTFNKVENPPGAVAFYLMKPDDGSDLIAVAVFESKEAYIANADRPEQQENFSNMMEYLNSEPGWTDGVFHIGRYVKG